MYGLLYLITGYRSQEKNHPHKKIEKKKELQNIFLLSAIPLTLKEQLNFVQIINKYIFFSQFEVLKLFALDISIHSKPFKNPGGRLLTLTDGHTNGKFV